MCRVKDGDAGKFVKSPITGELIEIAQMAEHMRISLIDPKWRVQRDAMLAKLRETTKASDDEIGRNLMGLARHRPDVFGAPVPLRHGCAGPGLLCEGPAFAPVRLQVGRRDTCFCWSQLPWCYARLLRPDAGLVIDG